jgi:hypothetical protein
MEDRSSERVRILVTQMARRGLSVNEVSRALISMVARSKSSNQRPDTLMQDRKPQLDENLLQRTAGPYIGVNRVGLAVHRSLPIYPRERTSPDGSGVVRFVPTTSQQKPAQTPPDATLSQAAVIAGLQLRAKKLNLYGAFNNAELSSLSVSHDYCSQ